MFVNNVRSGFLQSISLFPLNGACRVACSSFQTNERAWLDFTTRGPPVIVIKRCTLSSERVHAGLFRFRDREAGSISNGTNSTQHLDILVKATVKGFQKKRNLRTNICPQTLPKINRSEVSQSLCCLPLSEPPKLIYSMELIKALLYEGYASVLTCSFF